mgnify:CR=1 FL=1
MKAPQALKKGDTIALVSTARKISKPELNFAINLLNNWGLKVVFGEHLFEQHHQFAGTDEQRLLSFQECINNPEIKAILCVRGGYGTVRIIDQINFLPLVQNPKWIIGYSDITVLHNKLNNFGLESLHATMPINFETNTQLALDSLRQTLFGEPLSYQVENHELNQKGTAHGPVVGGNLSVLYSQLGSETRINTKGCILFLEDLDEYLYHIDRMMQNMARNGYFDEPAAVIIGGFTDMNDNNIPFGKTALQILFEYIGNRDYPVCFDFPAGHLNDNRALIFGRKAHLQVGQTVSLTFDV